MPAGTMTARRPVLRWRGMPAVLISLTAGLALVVPAPHAAADAAPMTASSGASSEGPPIPATAYVVNLSSLTPIATATNTPGAPIPVGADPVAIAITPDGRTAYVTGGSDTVTPIATAINTPGAPIPVGADPDAIAITPDGRNAYVANWTSGTVTPIATATNIPGAPIPVGVNPNHIAITPDGKTAYVQVWTSGTVTPIATATDTAGPPIPVGAGPDWLAITPDGKTVYVASINSGTVTPIATATNTAGPQIPIGHDAFFVAITPDGKTAYVAKRGTPTVTPIATATNTPGTPIPAGPGEIAITPDGTTAYVTSSTSGTVTPIVTATNTAGPPITVGTHPDAIAITPGAVTHAPAFTSGAAATAAYGARFSFTVTTTGSPAPKIIRRDWLPTGVRFTDNGNGTATISGTPRKTAAGVYPLTLTARNKYGTATQAFTLTVTRAPVIKKIRAIRVRVGAGLHLTVRATGYPTPALAESGPLPSGLTFTDNGGGTAVIRGTPAPGSHGRYPVTITATNTSGTATRHITIVVSRRRRQ
jgi:YVTN family beta-propeller protein